VRAIPETLDPSAVAGIDRLLDTLEQEEGARILLAVESGSRAWGFPSPDSDYDCRFIYVREADRYLSLWPPRDVIESPGDVLDVSGWDLGKALKLMLKGNAVAIEWLTSPIVYRGDAAFRQGMLALAARHVSRVPVMRHYLHLGERQFRTYLTDPAGVPLKKLFYVLRPAAALRWLMRHPDRTVAPMHFPTLMAECDPPEEIVSLVAGLLARKARTRELGTAPLPAPIAAFVADAFERARDFCDGSACLRTGNTAKAEADAFFRAAVLRP